MRELWNNAPGAARGPGRKPGNDAGPSALRAFADAAGDAVALAGGFAALRRLAFVDRAGQPIDHPGAFLGGILHAHIPGANCRDQGG